MTRYIKTDVTTGDNVKLDVNVQLGLIETAIADTLSRVGDTPNYMKSDLDMNSNQILNLPDAVTGGEPMTLRQAIAAASLIGTTTAALTTYTPSGGTATTVAAKLGEQLSFKDFGTTGNGSTDDNTEIQAALNSGKGSILVNEGTHFTSSRLTVGTSIAIKGTSRASSIIKGPSNTATTDGTFFFNNVDDIEITDLTIDGNRQASETKTSGSDRIAVNIIGDVSGSPIRRVYINNVRITNTAYHGITIEHCDEVIIGDLWLDNLYGNGLVISGCRKIVIGRINGVDIGNELAEGSRSGSCVILNGRSASTQINEIITIGMISSENTTDSGVYIGDGQTQGNSKCAAGLIVVKNSGKDGIKYESDFSNATFSSIVTDRISNVGVRIKGSKVSIGSAVITNTGVDVIGTAYTGSGVGESLQLVPAGMRLEGDDITINSVTIDEVLDAPNDNADGDGIYARECKRLSIKQVTIRNADARGLRLEACEDYDIDVKIRDCGKNGIATTTGVTVGSFGGTHSDGVLQLDSRDEQGTKTMTHAVRIFANSSAVIRNTTAKNTDHLGTPIDVNSAATVDYQENNNFGDTTHPVKIFSNADATPSVFGHKFFKTLGTTAITDFDDGRIGDTIKILAQGSITITDNAAIILNGSGSFAMTETDTLTLTMYDDQVWSEDARSVN